MASLNSCLLRVKLCSSRGRHVSHDDAPFWDINSRFLEVAGVLCSLMFLYFCSFMVYFSLAIVLLMALVSSVIDDVYLIFCWRVYSVFRIL